MDFIVSKKEIRTHDTDDYAILNLDSEPNHSFKYVYTAHKDFYVYKFYCYQLYDNLYKSIIFHKKLIFLKWFVKSKRYHTKQNARAVYFIENKKIIKFLKTHTFKSENKYLKGYKKN